MINTNIKNIIERFDNLILSFSFQKNIWTMKISNQYNDIDNEDAGIGDDDNTESLYEILNEVIEGTYLKGGGWENIGANDYEVYTYKKENNKIVLSEGKIYANGILSIEEINFSNELEFYIYVFDKFEYLFLETKDLKDNGLISPIELVNIALNASGYKLLGISYCGVDDEGYAKYTMHIKDEQGRENQINYPGKDCISVSIHNSIINKIESIDIYQFDSDFLNILRSIKNNSIKKYLMKHSYQQFD